MALSQLIVTSRYLKSGTAKSQNRRRSYTKYVATRETVEVREQNNKKSYATDNQKELLNELLTDFPEARKYLEYEDYTTDPSLENASELISAIIERNADIIGNKQNFVGYMAMRPGVEKRGAHGLFNENDKPIILDRVANEIANHQGNVWSHVISLRREDAMRLGYDNSDMWRELVKRHIDDIAKAQRIPLCNLKWYAAFHDTTHHPHIHLLVYSTNTKQGFLTKEGINKIRSAFANDIFGDELKSIYQEQTESRDELKVLSEAEFKRMVRGIQFGDIDDPQLEALILQLSSQLKDVRGKKVYGYLPPEAKKTVDKIFEQLAKNDDIQMLYKKWCDLEQMKYKTYTEKEKYFPALTDNKVFQPVRNMIIRTVLSMSEPVDEPQISEPTKEQVLDDEQLDISPQLDESEPQEGVTAISDDDKLSPIDQSFDNTYAVTGDTVDFESDSKYYIKWSAYYKAACKLLYDKNSTVEKYMQAEKILFKEADSGNVLAIHDLGKLYAAEKLGSKDAETSEHYYTEALKAFIEIEPNADHMFPYEPKFEGQIMKPKDMQSYIWYRIGKMHCYGLGTEQDYAKSFEWFLKSAQSKNKYAQFSIANQYYYGNGIEKDLSQAFSWYMASAMQNHPYAAYALAQMYRKGEYVTKDENTAQSYYRQALSGFHKIESNDQADDSLLYKLGVMYKNCLGTDVDMNIALDYFRRSAELDNKNGLYEYGKALLLGEHVAQDTEQAIAFLEKSMELGNINAKRFLALEYVSGEHISLDIDKGIEMLTECTDSRDSLSCYWLGKLYLEDSNYDIDKSVYYLEKSLADDSIRPYAAYMLAKVLLDDNPYHDTNRAVELLESVAEKNSWASYLLGRLYLFGLDEIEKDREKAVEWLARSADDGNEYASAMLEHIDDFENTAMICTVFALFASLSRCIEDDYTRKYNSSRVLTDKKLRRVIQRKKQELGQRTENSY